MSTVLRRTLATFLMGLLFFSAGGSHAGAPLGTKRVSAPLYTVHVEDEWGNRLRTFNHQGKRFILGAYGSAYRVRIENKTGQRVEAVLSVDGRDAVSGEVADYKSQRGYVIAPYDSVTIGGFRESFENVRQFRFTNPGNSYTGRRGTPQFVGVIGVAFFPERVLHKPKPQPLTVPRPAPSTPHYHYRGSPSPRAEAPRKSSSGDAARSAEPSDSAPSAGAPASKPSNSATQYGGGYEERERDDSTAMRREGTGNLGTEYGERSYSPVQEVTFTRQNPSNPRNLVSLYYDDESGLVARGIVVNPPPCTSPCCHPPCYREPEAFPATSRFAPPPP